MHSAHPRLRLLHINECFCVFMHINECFCVIHINECFCVFMQYLCKYVLFPSPTYGVQLPPCMYMHACMGACVHAGTRVLWTMAQPHFQQNLAVGRTSVVVAEKCYVDLLEGVDQVG